MKHVKAATIIALLGLSGCAMFGSKQTVAKLAEQHTTITGTLVAAPTLMNSNKRLALYLQEQPEPEPKDVLMKDGNGDTTTTPDGTVVLAPKVPSAVGKEIILCITENEQNKQVLINIAEYLKDPKAQGKPVFLYGRRLDSAWHEYVSGVNCTFDAIGLYVPANGQYVVIQSIFGDGLFDQTDWTAFAVTVFKTGIKFVK
jgi:hypothetical protein